MRKFFITFCFLLVAYISIGQQQTAYERKVASLRVQLLRKLGVNQTLLDQKSKLGDLESLFLLGDILKKLNTEQGVLLLLQFNREVKEAEKLKTTVDFQREKEKKEKAEKEAKLKQIEYEQKQAKLEKEKLEKERLERINNSDYVKIKSEVTAKFNAWLKKGEFEKTDDYENRMKNQCLENFQKINFEAIEKRTNQINEDDLEFALKEYNADKEYFSIDIKFKDLKWTDVIKVSISKAPEFKDNFRIIERKTIYQNWGIYDNQLYPQKIVITEYDSKNQYEFSLPISKLEDYKISTSILGISNSNFDKLEFSFFDYQNKKNEELELLNKQKKQKEEEALRLATLKQKQEEEFRELQAKQYKLERSDFGKLKKSVKEKIEKWILKSDFETASDYQKRIESESQTKLNQVTNEEAAKKSRVINANLDSYNSETENFIVLSKFGYDGENYSTDTFLVNVPKTIAPGIFQSIKQMQESDNRTSITIVPNTVIMYNNKWTITDATIVFCVRCNCSCSHSYSSYTFKLQSDKNGLYAICQDAPRDYDNKDIKYTVKEFKDFPKDSPYANGLFYSTFKKQIQTNNQLDFSFESLDIKLPTFAK